MWRRSIDAVLSDDDARRTQVIAAQDAALARLAPRTSAARCCVRGADAARRRARAAPPVAFDFWEQLALVRAARGDSRAVAVQARCRALPEGRLGRDDRQPVDAGGASRRRDRRLGASRARPAALARATVRHLRADDRRGHARGGPAVRRRRRARGDVTIFHFALPSPMTPAFAALPRRARAPVPQHHAGALLRATTSRRVPDRGARAAGSASAGRSRRPRARRVGLQPAGARSAGISAHRRPADRRRLGANHRSAAPHPVLDTILNDGLTNFLFVGRIVAEQARSRTSSAWPSSTSGTSTRTTASSSSAAPTASRATTPPCAR